MSGQATPQLHGPVVEDVVVVKSIAGFQAIGGKRDQVGRRDEVEEHWALSRCRAGRGWLGSIYVAVPGRPRAEVVAYPRIVVIPGKGPPGDAGPGHRCRL